jgi:hypothetical protein
MNAKRVPTAPLPILDVLEKLQLMDGLQDFMHWRGGSLLLFTGYGAKLIRILKPWGDKADELAAKLAHIGLCVALLNVILIAPVE